MYFASLVPMTDCNQTHLAHPSGSDADISNMGQPSRCLKADIVEKGTQTLDVHDPFPNKI